MKYRIQQWGWREMTVNEADSPHEAAIIAANVFSGNKQVCDGLGDTDHGFFPKGDPVVNLEGLVDANALQLHCAVRALIDIRDSTAYDVAAKARAALALEKLGLK